jgi:hypothetical protein
MGKTWEQSRARYKALELFAFRGGVIGLLTVPWVGVVVGLLGVVRTEYPVDRLTNALILGLNGAGAGFVLGVIMGALFGMWKRFRV